MADGMADDSYDYDFNPASPDAHGWWPLFQISGRDPDEDDEPLWDCAVYERPTPDRVLVAWKSMIDLHGNRNSEQPGQWTGAEGWAFAYEALGDEDCNRWWNWRAYIGRNEQQFQSMRQLRLHYHQMREGTVPSMANARLFAVEFGNEGHEFSVHLPADSEQRYTMQMVLDDREPLEEWLQYQAQTDPYAVPEWLLMIRRVTHVRVIDSRTRRPVSSDAWSPAAPTPYYVATRGRYTDFLDGRRTAPAPRFSTQLGLDYSHANAQPVTWLLDDWFQNLGDYVGTQHLTHETRAAHSFPTSVADRSARTDVYTLAQERGEAPRHRVTMLQAINAARVIHRCSKAAIRRAWAPKGWKVEEGKRALRDMLGPSGDGGESSSPASKRPAPASASDAGPSGSGTTTTARAVFGRRGGSLPSLAGLRL